MERCVAFFKYIWPSQTRDIFETFAKNSGLTLYTFINENPFLIGALDNFNGKAPDLYKDDTNYYEGSKNCYHSILIWLTLIT